MNSLSDIRVLLVDDESTIRFITGEALRDEGLDVTEAANSAEALELFKDPDHFDVLFTDVQMPGAVDGLGLASIVRKMHPDLPILIASGYALNVEPRLNSVAAPLMFIHKPYELHKIVAALKQLVVS